MTTDYLALLRTKKIKTPTPPTDKTDKIQKIGSSVSFVSAQHAHIQKNTPPEQPLPVTGEWFNSQGCDVLIFDLAYIKRHLPIGTAKRNAVLRAYVDQWHQAMNAEPVPQRKDNAGRRAANTWLRERTV